MIYSLCDAQEAFDKIKFLEQNRKEGIVVNIAERLWAGCSYDDPFNPDVRDENDIIIFHSGYHDGMVDLVFPGDLCLCMVEKKHSFFGDRVLQCLQEYMKSKQIPASASGSDFLVLTGPRSVGKLGSYGIVITDSGMCETTIHISIDADITLINRFRKEPLTTERVGAGKFGVTAEELLVEISKTL